MKQQLESLIGNMVSGGILYSEAVREFKRKFIVHILDRNNHNQSRAARELGMHRNTLSRTISELNIEIQEEQRRKPMRSAQITDHNVKTA